MPRNELHAQRVAREPQARFFQSLKAYDESGSLVKAVFRKGVTVLIEEHAQDDLAVVATYFRVGRLTASPELCEIGAQVLRRSLSSGVHDAGGLVDVQVGDRITSARTIISSISLRDAVRAHLGLFHLEEKEWDLDRAFVESHESSLEPRGEPGLGELAQMLGAPPTPAEPAVEGGTVPPERLFDSVSLEALEKFFGSFYTPANSILTAVGTVRREQVLSMLAEEMQDFQAPAQPAEGAGQTGRKSEVERVESESTVPGQNEGLRYGQQRVARAQPVVQVGFRVPDVDEPGALALELVRYALAEGYASLLEMPREDEKEPPALVSTRYQSMPDGRLLVFELGPTDSLEKAEIRLFSLLRALSSNDLPMRLLNRAKAMLVADWYRDLEALDSRSRRLAEAEFRDSYKSRDQFPSRVSAVNASEFRKVIQEYCTSKKAALLEILPTSFEVRSFTTESFRETLEILVPAGVEKAQAFLDSIDALGKVKPFSMPGFTPGFADLPPRRSSVLRGPEIYLREDHRQPIVHVGLFFAGGVLSESPAQAGLTRFLTSALLENLRRADGGRALLALESKGARISVATYHDFFGIRAVGLVSGFDEVFLQLVGWLHDDLTFTEEDIDLAARRLEAERHNKRRNGMPPLVAEGVRRVFAGFPYGQGLDLGKVPFSLDQVNTWKKDLMEKIHPTIIVSGDVSGTGFLEGMVSKLSDPAFSDARLPGTRVTYPEKLPIRVSEGQREGLFFEGPKTGSVDVAMLDVARQLLNGAAGRVTLRLRRQGVGYRGRLGLLSLVKGGICWLSVDPVEGKADEAVDLALTEVRNVTGQSMAPFDFRAAQVAAITDWLIRQRNPEAYLYDTMEAALAQEPADYGTRYVLNVRSLRRGEIEQVLRRFMGEVQ